MKTINIKNIHPSFGFYKENEDGTIDFTPKNYNKLSIAYRYNKKDKFIVFDKKLLFDYFDNHSGLYVNLAWFIEYILFKNENIKIIGNMQDNLIFFNNLVKNYSLLRKKIKLPLLINSL